MWLDKFNELRRTSGLSLDEISAKSGVPKGTLAKITSGITKNPALETMRSLVHAMGFSLDDIEDEGLSNTYSIAEKNLIKVYRKLDARGKNTVDLVLNGELSFLPKQSAEIDTMPMPLAEMRTDSHPRKDHVISMADERSKPKVNYFKPRTRNGISQVDVFDQGSAAGIGNYLNDPSFHVEQYPSEIVPEKTDFGVIITGDSMEPKVHDGGTAFVHASITVEPGHIGIFVLNGHAYCKMLQVDKDNKQIRLVSLNKKYEDIIVSEFDSFRTVGMVIGQWTKGYEQQMFGW